jgi:hypothetical protein
MKSQHIKNGLLGIALAIVAAYLYVVALAIYIEGPRGALVFFSTFPLMVLLYTSWIVIPLGAALGILIPPLASGKSRGMAALQGAALGAVSGLLSLLCLMSAYHLRRAETFIVLSVMAYCALWVGAYAFYRAKGQSLYR